MDQGSRQAILLKEHAPVTVGEALQVIKSAIWVNGNLLDIRK